MTITRRQERRGAAAEWTSTNPVLASGEWGYERNTGKVKIGDGTTAWAGLPYNGGGGAAAPLVLTATGTDTALTLNAASGQAVLKTQAGRKHIIGGTSFVSTYATDIVQIGQPRSSFPAEELSFGHNGGVLSVHGEVTGTGGGFTAFEAIASGNPTIDSTTGVRGAYGSARFYGSHNLDDDLIGSGGLANHTGTGQVRGVFGTMAEAYAQDGHVLDLRGHSVYLGHYGSGVVDNLYGVRVVPDLNGTGQIVDAYGLHIGDLLAGTSPHTNAPFAIYTDGAAKSRLGGALEVLGGATASGGGVNAFGTEDVLTVEARIGAVFVGYGGAAISFTARNNAAPVPMKELFKMSADVDFADDGTLDGYRSWALTDMVTGLNVFASQSGETFMAQPVRAADDVEATTIGKGLVCKSPNGNRWRLTPSNAGASVWTAL